MSGIAKVFGILLLVGFSCLQHAPVYAGGVLKVAASILPQKYFLQKIGGDLLDVTVMIPPGANPATYEPKPKQMIALARCKVYFAAGVPFESVWLGKFRSSNPDMVIVQSDAGIQKLEMQTHLDASGKDENKAVGESLTPEHEHARMPDPHVWLSPPLAMLIARNIMHALVGIDPEHAERYTDRYGNFISEIVTLDRDILSIFRGAQRPLRFMVFHPAWGYFAAAYGLRQVPIELEGKEPKARDLERLIKFARRAGIDVIFVQPQFSTKSARTIAQSIGARIVFADPLAFDWANNLREVAKKVAVAGE